MKEAIVKKGPKVDIIDSPIPTPEANQVIIKVVISGSNPKDWKLPAFTGVELNQGDDIAGIVHAVGDNVTEFKVGDRVAAFHEIFTSGGSYAEYSVAWAHTTFHLPKQVSFEEAATLPLASLTAAVGLYTDAQLGLPNPWAPTTEPTPIVVYGGSSAVGAFAIKFAQKSNLHPIIAVAGNGAQFVEGIIDRSKGDTIVDYRKGDDAVVQGIKDALKGEKLLYAYDAVSVQNSSANIGKALAPGGKLTTVLPVKKEDLPDNVILKKTSVGSVHKEEKDFGFVFSRVIARGLDEGWYKAHPHEVLHGGLQAIEEGLARLRDGKASAVKYVFRIDETPGIQKGPSL